MRCALLLLPVPRLWKAATAVLSRRGTCEFSDSTQVPYWMWVVSGKGVGNVWLGAMEKDQQYSLPVWIHNCSPRPRPRVCLP